MSISLSRPGVSHEEQDTKKHQLCPAATGGWPGPRREHHEHQLVLAWGPGVWASRPRLQHHEHRLVLAWCPGVWEGHPGHGSSIMRISSSWLAVDIKHKKHHLCPVVTSGGPAHSESIMSISLSRPGVSHEEQDTKKHHLCPAAASGSPGPRRERHEHQLVLAWGPGVWASHTRVQNHEHPLVLAWCPGVWEGPPGHGSSIMRISSSWLPSQKPRLLSCSTQRWPGAQREHHEHQLVPAWRQS